MAEIKVNWPVLLRRDTAANWAAKNPTLRAGEVGIETDTTFFKVGDGTTAWTSLKYVTAKAAQTDANGLTIDSSYLKLTGGTVTGNVTASSFQTGTAAANYFQCQKFRGQGNADTYYHAIDFGYAGHDVVDFHEYGGVWNFYKNTSGKSDTGALVGSIKSTGWNGPVVGNVTGNVTGNAATTTKLATARTVQTNLASTAAASFDGSANITPGVTGTLPAANGGTGQTSLDKVTVGAAKSTPWAGLGGVHFFDQHQKILKLGTFTVTQNGDYLEMIVRTGIGFNAALTQNHEVTIHFRASNGATSTHEYAAYAEYGLNGPGALLYYINQVSATSFELYQAAVDYPGESFIQVKCAKSVTFMWSGASVTALPTAAVQVPAYTKVYQSDLTTYATKDYVAQAIKDALAAATVTYDGKVTYK